MVTRPYYMFLHICLSIVSEINTENYFNEILSAKVNGAVYDQTAWQCIIETYVQSNRRYFACGLRLI